MTDNVKVTIELTPMAIEALRINYRSHSASHLEKCRSNPMSLVHVDALVLDALPRPFKVGDRVQWKDPHDHDTATVLAMHGNYLWVAVDDGEPCSEEARWMMHATETER